MVRIGDFESLDPGSIPGKTLFLNDFNFIIFFIFTQFIVVFLMHYLTLFKDLFIILLHTKLPY